MRYPGPLPFDHRGHIMPVADWTPLVEDVAALLRARTIDNNGAEVGTFNTDTRPTDTEADVVIAHAVDEISARVGLEIPEIVWPIAKRAASLRAAMLIELSYWPEQVRSQKSPYEHYRDMYNDQIKAVEKAVKEAGSGDPEEVGSVDDAAMPSFGFPVDTGGMIGWGTRF